MDFLKEILGADLYGRVEAAITAYNGKPDNQNRQIKLCNLSGGEYVSRGKYSKLESEKAKTEEALEAANSMIEQLRAAAPPDEAEYQRRVTSLEQQLKQIKIDTAVKAAFLVAGVTDMEYMNFKLREAGELELDGSGRVKGLDERIDRLKTQFPGCFPQSKAAVVFEGFHITQVNNGFPGITRDNLLRMPYKAVNQFFMENPDLYREIVNQQ